jgi:spermidine synthase
VNDAKKSLLAGIALASGAASFIYLFVWTRHLGLSFGDTPTTTAATLALFFAGLALGAWAWNRLVGRHGQSSFTVLAALEIAMGLYGFASLWILRGIEFLYSSVYPSFFQHPIIFDGARFLLAALGMLPPMILMGVFVSLLSNSFKSSAVKIVSAVGAVVGWCMLGAAGAAAALIYGLLPALGLEFSVLLAATLNIVVGAAVFMLARIQPKIAATEHSSSQARFPVRSPSGDRAESLLMFVRFGALGFAAVVFGASCARLLAMAMGASVYVYNALIVLVLTAAGIGSIFYARAERSIEEHQKRLAALECGLALTAALSMAILPRISFLYLRYFSLFRNSFGRQIAAYFAAAGLVGLLPSLLLGAAFPAMIGSIRESAIQTDRKVGTCCAAYATGAAVGILLSGFVISMIGLHGVLTLSVVVIALLGCATWWMVRAPQESSFKLTAVAALLVVCILYIWPAAWPRQIFAAGIGIDTPGLGQESVSDVLSGMRLMYYRDGANSTVSVDDVGENLSYRSNGKMQGSTKQSDLSAQLLLGHLPMLLNSAPREIFVEGLGTGVTAAAVARYPAEEIDIVEAESATAQAARFFESYNRKVLDDPRVHLVTGDGRSHLLGMRKQYDVVIARAPGAWEAGGESRYTVEYYRIVAARLKTGGVFAQAIDTRALLPDDLDPMAATFHAVFPNMQIWTPAPGLLIFLGAREGITWDYPRLKQHFDHTQGVEQDLQSAGIWSPFALFGAQILGESGSAALARDMDATYRDDHPLLEFRAPRSLYVDTLPLVANDLNRFVLTGAPAIAGFDPERDLDAEGAYLLGFAYASVGRSDLAIPYMERSTHLSPKDAALFVGLANEYRSAGRLTDASRAYERALELDINNVEALVSLGEIRFEQGQLDWTRVLASRALRLAPQNVRVHALVGKLQAASR